MKIVKEVDYIQVIGVDNILNKLLDPVLIGYATHNKLEAAMKVVIKTDPKESVGVVAKKNGHYDIVEYSEISSED